MPSALSHLFLRELSIHHTAEPGPKKWQSSGRGGTWVPELLCGAVTPTPTTLVCHVSKKWNFLFLNSHCEFGPLCWSSLALTPTHTVLEVGHAPDILDIMAITQDAAGTSIAGIMGRRDHQAVPKPLTWAHGFYSCQRPQTMSATTQAIMAPSWAPLAPGPSTPLCLGPPASLKPVLTS